VVFCGEDITQLAAALRARRGIARSFQIPRPFKSMTVLENLMVGLDFATVGSSLPEEDVAMSILTRMGSAAKAARRPIR
jgi:branched-chain amino acid transport system ATP-binding protein